MDEKKINSLIDKFDTDEGKALLDKAARGEIGIQRLDLELADGTTAILTKNIPGISGYNLNLFSKGTITFDPMAIFTVDSIDDEIWRLLINTDTFSYWVDLKDEAMAKRAAEFAGVVVTRN